MEENTEIPDENPNWQLTPSATDMEVHHHPQLEHKPKPWKYIFLSILLRSKNNLCRRKSVYHRYRCTVAGTHEIFDYSVYYDSAYYRNNAFTGKQMPLLTDNPVKQKIFLNKIVYEKGATDNYIRNIQQRMPFLKSLISFLQKEYHLE